MESDYKRCARHARQLRKFTLKRRRSERNFRHQPVRHAITATTPSVRHIESHSIVHEDGSVTTYTNYQKNLNQAANENIRNHWNHPLQNEHSVAECSRVSTTLDMSSDDNSDELIITEVEQVAYNSDADDLMRGKIDEIWDFGDPDRICQFCGAVLWYEERSVKSKKPLNPTYTICCQQGSVQLPLLRETPTVLKDLLDYEGDSKASKFRDNIRIYNSMFAFTSMGGQIDKSVNDGHGPYVFRINGQNHHKIGSLLPVAGQKPRFAQLYIYDTENEVSNRLKAITPNVQGRNLDAQVITDLLKMLDENNGLAKIFRMAKDRFGQSGSDSVRLRLIGTRQSDGRQYNVPTSSEIAALMVGDGFQSDEYRDVIVEEKSVGLKRINEIHPSFMAMQYPLLFPYAEDGFRIGIPYTNIRKRGKGARKNVTIREYYAFRIQQRSNEGQTLIRGGRLYQQFLVDAYACIEENRLRFVKSIQSELRFDLYNGLRDAIVSGDTRPASVGKRLVLPSSFTGGPRYMVQNYQDAIAICRWAGPPDLFITFTCNPKWMEVQRFLNLIRRQKGEDRSEIVARVFKIKLDQLMKDLRHGRHFGKVIAAMYTIEFQKRGLPHAHILVFLDKSDKASIPSAINKFISAELPNQLKDPLGFQTVVDFMIHGPCGLANLDSPCMVKDKCCRHFPKKFNNETVVDKNGFPVYRRRKNSRTALKNGINIDNRWVVPYNRDLVVKYQAHINVEHCNQTKAVKYLFKYINKGSDMATIVIENNSPSKNLAGKEIIQEVDEIKRYLDCRYISASEASWRILDFEIQFHKPAVERLSYHLPDEQPVIFRETDDIANLTKIRDLEISKFSRWMEANALYPDARQLTYTEFPTKWTWCPQLGIWKRRGGQRAMQRTEKEKIKKIGRIYYAHPTTEEKYYLRMLLNIIKGPTKFADIRTVNNVVYPDFKSACSALGLLDDDNEWHQALEEASHWATSAQLREMFVTLLLFCEIADPLQLWNRHCMSLSDDISRRESRLLENEELQLSDDQIKNYALLEIENIMSRNGKSLKAFASLPFPDASFGVQTENRLIREELNYNRDQLHKEYLEMYSHLNVEQKNVFEIVTENVRKQCGGFFFVYGSGGTGKTYLWNTIIAKLRSDGRIVLAVASSGIASLLLPGGKTAHSRFKIPIDPDDYSCCDIKQQTHLAELIRKADLVIWDEAPMLNRNIFEAVDRTFRDLMRFVDNDSTKKVFGGKAILFGGDFRQILPVIRKGKREEIVAATINRSAIWKFCELFSLSINMRLQNNSLDDRTRESVSEFTQWVLDLGDGKLPSISLNEDDEPSWIQIPHDMLIPAGDNPIAQIVTSTYPNLVDKFGDIQYLSDRCILAPTNQCVDEINSFVISSLPGHLCCYFSADSISRVSESIENQDILFPVEFLNTLEFSGIASHKIELKVGVPIMMIRNVNQNIGLCNGTRLIVTQLATKVIEAEIITGSNIGRRVFIPRIIMSANDTKWPFILRRRQFPIKICFAMTINKSQGQTLKSIGIFLPRPVFTHGQLYVAVSRASSRDGLKILIVKKDNEPEGYTQNIVYHEVFNDLYTGSLTNVDNN